MVKKFTAISIFIRIKMNKSWFEILYQNYCSKFLTLDTRQHSVLSCIDCATHAHGYCTLSTLACVSML